MAIDKIGKTYSGRKVLVTGHTGFKGAWLSIWLLKLGADVVGFSYRNVLTAETSNFVNFRIR